MTRTELDIGEARSGPRATSRRAALDALERLLRAHQTLDAQRDRESPYGLLRGAREDELDLIEATFRHCGVPLPDALRAIYHRTLGVGNPVDAVPVLAVPFLRAALPDEGFGCPIVGLEAFEAALGLYRDEAASERPPFLVLGHAELAGLAVSRNGLWSFRDYQGQRDLPPAQDFELLFEVAFTAFVDQVLLIWANDLAGAPVKPRDLDLARGARLEAVRQALRDAMGTLLAPRTLGAGTWGKVEPLDSADLLRATRRGDETASPDARSPFVAVVGLPYGDRPEELGRLGPGTLLRLRPVEDNPHDPDAIEVWHDGEAPYRVGFVARAEAPRLRALPDGAQGWQLRVKGRTEGAVYATLERLLANDGGGPGEASAGRPGDLFSPGP